MARPVRNPAPLAYVAEGALLHPSVEVHAGAWIGAEVELAAGVVVGPGAVLGFADRTRRVAAPVERPDPEGPAPTVRRAEAVRPPPETRPEGPAERVRVGEGAYLGPGVHLEPGVEIGPRSAVESGSILRRGTRVGGDVYVGPRCVIMGHCTIQDYVSLFAEVHVCPYALLQSHCQVMPGVKLLNDPCPPTGLDLRGPTIGPCAVLGVNAVIWSGVHVGCHAIVAAASVVKQNVPDYVLVGGSPAKPLCDTRWIRVQLRDRWVYPYPWTRWGIEGEDVTRPEPR